MNLKQKLYIEATAAAQTIPATDNDHALATAQLATFNSQGFDPLDYPDWLQCFSQAASVLNQRAGQKAESEKAAKKPAVAAA